ncbi:MAG: cobalt-precorrin-5B (C(1))-methyltransferase CbiD [Eubacterium sp.]|nr:cobalt-precorrin-5B (C(1))-methyltransferase CbiD [Eubacterium sp.]MDD7208493.1 cobalt-precorrin-5B (C(1))-methyltransferase CbiD [Lachnospiraceae bacterium]MDY5497616.1 cobalt-precorrin-5B (C(1))-methyltransferase CbiD [Anaerobutyricum sp.]
MKKLREGVSTGSCMTGGAIASVLWQTTGKCPSVVEVDAPIGRKLYLDIIPEEFGTCCVIKDAGDDPDVTDGSRVITSVRLFEEEGEITFHGGEGIGTVTQDGLKIPCGQPAINPVPRKMVKEALYKIIGKRRAEVTVSIPGGEILAKKTFNPRLGIVGGLSVLGTTGIVRPMSEEAMKDSLLAELDIYARQGHTSILFVLGGTGEASLKEIYGEFSCVIQVSNYIGFMIEEAVERGFRNILIGGFVGKLVKVASGTMNTHSHVADGRIETICTHAALHGADVSVIRRIYSCLTTKAAMQIVEEEGLGEIWKDMAEKASWYCEKTARHLARVGIIFLDGKNDILAESQNVAEILSVLIKMGGNDE